MEALGGPATALWVWVASLAIKLLLVPAYRSTDFEVHRNWLAITHSLPLSQWYTEETSQWTLDYPPLFAWFEWVLSQGARLADPAMLEVGNLEYASDATVWFQRGSVMATELVLVLAAWAATRGAKPGARALAVYLVAANPGLIMVDHVHFQYNGVLLGLFVGALALCGRGASLAGALAFAVLLSAKHIFLYAAPAFFVHLLRHHCRGRRAALNFLQLGAVVAAVFGLAFGPWLALGQAGQLAKRLFPFGRGLCHAYWAPNLWALYAAADKALAAALPRLGVRVAATTASMTGGLVGSAEFVTLPAVGSGATALLTLASMAPALAALWRDPAPERLPAAALYCTMCSFMLGYHVHEKAILMVSVPLAVLAAASGDRPTARAAHFLGVLGTYSLFPLIHEQREYPVKVLLLLSYLFVGGPWLTSVATPPRHTLGGKGASATPSLLAPGERAFLLGLLPLELYCTWGHPVLLGGRLPFLPLLLTSVYCAAGMLHAWLRLLLPAALGGAGGGVPAAVPRTRKTR